MGLSPTRSKTKHRCSRRPTSRPSSSTGDIQISWNASSQPNVRGYNVYRVDNENDIVAPLNDAVLEVTSVVDGGARFGHEYDYRVTAVSTKNTESAFSSVTIRNREAPTDRKDDNPGEID